MEKLTYILAVAADAMQVPLVLDKAASVARCFGARIEVLATDAETCRAVVAHSTARDYPNVTFCSVSRGQEALQDVILRCVMTSRPDLVIKLPASGLASGDRHSLHDNDWQLANECPAPVMLVRCLQWSDPLRLAAAVDVSDEENADLARSLLRTAGFLTLGMQGALDVLYSEREAHDEALRMERAVRLAHLVREFHMGCERIEMFSGEPESRLPPLMAARRYDVLVLGGQSRREGLAAFMPGTVARVMESSESDVVLVRAPTTEAGFTRSMVALHEQRAHQ